METASFNRFAVTMTATVMSLKIATWKETSAAALWLAAAGGLFWLDSELPGPAKAALWIVLAVGLLIVLRRFWSWLLGPLFIYDLVRTARRNRLIPVRLLYALLTLLIISVTYSRWFGFQWSDGQFFEPALLRPDLLPSFANSFFTSFVMLLISAVVLLTPIYIATAIVEERERGNLDLLLVTPLTNREIVLGIMMSRLATLSLILATGLPILSLLPFFGGVDPAWVLGAFAIAGGLMLVLGGISIYVSVGAQNSLRAIVNVYLLSLALGACCGPFMLSSLAFSSIYSSSPSPWETAYFLSADGVVIGFAIVGFAIARLRRSGPTSEPRSTPPRGLDIIADRPVSKEMLRLRWLAHDLFRLPITEPPMLWKDFHRRRRDNLPRLTAAVASCFYLYFCLVILATESSGTTTAVGPWAICIMLIPIAITSVRMVSQEKEKRTLDSLLITDLDHREILFGKWWASILPMRGILVIQAAVLFLGGLGGLLHPLASVYLLGATIVYTCFVACLGLLISTFCDTVLRSTMISVAALLVFIFAGPLGLVSPSTNPRNPTDWLLNDVINYALSPIDTLRCLAFQSVDWEHDSARSWQIVAALVAIGLVALVSWGLWKLTLLSFEKAVKGPAPRHSSSGRAPYS